MFKTRPCGCKGLRSCKICEEKYGAWKLEDENCIPKENGYIFCSLCKKLWPGWKINFESHPQHEGNSLSFSGILLLPEFISECEEAELLKNIDSVPWDPSQSGRYKQNYGPKCNFKKRKVQLGNFCGYPNFTKFIQDKFKSVGLLENFQTVEQCSLDYSIGRGSSIDPHIDDCWIWGERIPTLSLLSDSVLTLRKYKGPLTKYNLQDSHLYPHKSNKGIKDSLESNKAIKDSLESNKGIKDSLESNKGIKDSLESNTNDVNECSISQEEFPDFIRIPMPRRSLLVLFGAARYEYEHFIFREDITERRVCITYRELTPLFLEGGPQEAIGKDILERSLQYFNPHDAENG